MLVLFVVALTVLAVVQYRQLTALSMRLDRLTRGVDGSSLEGILGAHLDKVSDVGRDLDLVTARTSTLEAETPHALQRVGLVRFNPFEDTGGNQSFALALLDARGDGFILSSLHARSGTRVYGKVVSGGRPETALSEEESQALRSALASPGRRWAG